jgi:hypothetical protein
MARMHSHRVHALINPSVDLHDSHAHARASPMHNVASHLGRAEGLFQDMKAVVNKDMVKKVSAHPWHGILSRSFRHLHTSHTCMHSGVHAKCNPRMCIRAWGAWQAWMQGLTTR